ncbi:hypothetical protein [Siminovitchia terrae]|uniref:hypothetical protein n=1 Tax=Siminovitchia terrae TaxID=1914933 RepID=UPI0028B200CF|nr:hypothetical protein [Siminovitchia terrae]
MKKRKGFIVVSLAVLVIFTLFSPINSLPASASATSGEVSNFNEIRNDGKVLEYTYDLDGQSYKNVEVFDADFEGASSKIYKENDSGEYVLVAEKRSVIHDEELIVETKENNEVTVDTYEINTDNLDNNGQINLEENITLSNSVTTMKTTGWKYQMTTKTSDNIKRLTAAAISIVAAKVLPWGGAALVQLGQIAYSLNLPNLYYSIKWYYKYNGIMPVSEKKMGYVYKDKARTKLLKGPITTIKNIK